MPDGPSFAICIDESGDQGFTFEGENRSTDWFVISGIVFLNDRLADVNAAIREAKQSIAWNNRKPLHFKRVNNERRVCVLNSILRDQTLFRAISVLIHKPSLIEVESLSSDNRLYFYYTRYLLERASWLCRDSREATEKSHGDGTARVIFSAMNEVSRASVGEYFEQLQGMQTQIDWSVLNPQQFETLRPGQHSGLQIADVVAGSFYCPNHHCAGPRTDEWARMLRPVMYRSRRGKYQGYGIKLCPKQAENQNAQNALAPWAFQHYPL